MTDVFRSEILAVVMQQIMDEPVIPLLFMRTVSPSSSPHVEHRPSKLIRLSNLSKPTSL